MIEYLNELREACLDAYTGIVQGLKGDADTPNRECHVPHCFNNHIWFLLFSRSSALAEAVSALEPHVQHITAFLESVYMDEESTEQVVASGCGLIGDLSTAFGANMLQFFDREPISSLLTKGRRSKAPKTKQLATWATRELRKLKNQSSW